MNDSDWKPPFCALHDVDLNCPVCGEENSVCVREHVIYYDNDVTEAYCSECHVNLEVQISVEVSFSDPEVLG